MVKKLLQLIHEGPDIFKLPVNGGKSDISNRVKRLQFVHDKLADFGTGNFFLFHIENDILHFVDKLRNLGNADGPLVAGAEYTGLDFGTVISFPDIALLDYNERNGLNLLISRKALPALFTLSATADCVGFFGGSGINNLCIFISAKRTLHAFYLFLRLVRILLCRKMLNQVNNIDVLAGKTDHRALLCF